ncbi:MAG: acyltransferase [Lachnospiraceae bacterium]|nr:acyltransferase [Lachnospiraceae bacterium]
MSGAEKKYIKSFDALRVIALLGVFLYHLMPNLVPSGYLGVVIFFVLAGFLTMKQVADGGRMISAPTTVLAKIRDKILKLYPALLFTIIIVTVCMCYYFSNFLIQYPVDAVSSALSFNNYAQILRNESYFEAMNSIKPLTHIWALSLEFQFYVAFFLLVLPFYKKENKNKYLVAFSVLTILSLALSIYLVLNGANLTRIYYGFDSRLATFLIGVICALVADSVYEYMKKAPAFVKMLEVILLLVMVYAMVVSFGTDQEVIGIIIIYSFLCGILILLLYCDDRALQAFAPTASRSKHVGADMLSALTGGIVRRSYVIYLVHYPIIIFSNRFLAHATNIDMRLYFITIIVVVLIVSEIIYRLVQILFFKHNNKKLSGILIIAMLLIVLASAILINRMSGDAPKSDDKNDTTWITNEVENDALEHLNDESNEAVIDGINNNAVKDMIATESDMQYEEINVDGLYDEEGNLLATKEEINSYQIQTVFSRINKVNALIGGDATLTREEFLKNRNMKISFIGDSVTQGSRGSLSVYFPNAVINAEGNRQLRKALPIFYEMKEKGELGDIVVVALGTNSDKEIRVDVLEEIYENLDDRLMIILTVAIPYVVMEQQRNAALRKFADTHDNCHLADWYSTMKPHKEYFIGDDTHPQGLGTDVYAQLIFKTAIESLEWRKSGNEWQYFGSGDKMKFAVEIEKNVGDTIEFGSYYINSSDKKEPIEWIIVDKNEEIKTELLISKYALERRKYNEVYASTTWQKSDVRKWLNSEFYSEAFENVGAKFILSSQVDNHKNPDYRTVDANATYDRVFLPSYDEIKKYLSDEQLKCKPTNHFKDVGGYVNKYGFVDWWSRTAGDSDNHVLYVSSNGDIEMKGDYVTTDDFAIRPMIRVTYK